MNAPDDEILMRWSDGELSPDAAGALEARAAKEPGLAARMQALRRLRTAAREAFPAAVDERDRDLARLIASGPRAHPFRFAGVGRTLADAFAPTRAAVWGGLAAAAFVGGLVLAPVVGGKAQGVRVTPDGALTDAALVRVLDDRLASDDPDSGGRSVGLSFRDREGRWCRTFQSIRQGVAGLACRRGDGWAMQVLAPLGESSGEVRLAASATPEIVLSAVDAAIAGPAADAATEARARDARWR